MKVKDTITAKLEARRAEENDSMGYDFLVRLHRKDGVGGGEYTDSVDEALMKI